MGKNPYWIGMGAVLALEQPFPTFRDESLFPHLRNVRQRLSVDASRFLVCPYSPPRLPQHIRPAYLVVQSMESSALACLGSMTWFFLELLNFLISK